MTFTNNTAIVLDIGTSKLVALAGKKDESGKITVLASSTSSANGFKRGIVLNIDLATQSIKHVLTDLSNKLNQDIESVCISFAGPHLITLDYKGYRYTKNENIIKQEDIDFLYNEARNQAIADDYEQLVIEPQSYLIDDEIEDPNPVGITGKKIEASYKIVAVPKEQINNLKRVFEKVDVKISEIVPSPVAISEYVLTEDEKEIGSISLDIGAGTTKMSIFNNSVLIDTFVVPFAGDVISKDIKEGCSIQLKYAEQLKMQYGEALGDFADDQKVVTIPAHNGWQPKEISFKSLAYVIQARLEEIIDSINDQIIKCNIDNFGSGIVVSGGTAELNNIISLVKFRTGLDAKKAHPAVTIITNDKQLSHQKYFTALGLLKLTLDKTTNVVKKQKKKKQKREAGFSNFIKNAVQGVFDYVNDDDLEMN